MSKTFIFPKIPAVRRAGKRFMKEIGDEARPERWQHLGTMWGTMLHSGRCCIVEVGYKRRNSEHLLSAGWTHEAAEDESA